MDAFADADDLTAVSLPLTAEQQATVDGLLAQASTKIRGWGLERGINVDELIADDELRAEIVKDATVNIVKRALGVQGLQGLTEVTVAIDDFRETRKRDSTSPATDVYVTATDLVGLFKKRARFGTLRLGAAL